eukprot:gene6135-1062_t
MWAALTFPAWGDVPFGVLFVLSLLQGRHARARQSGAGRPQGHAQLACDVASVSVTVRNFPNHRGLALGVCKALGT